MVVRLKVMHPQFDLLGENSWISAIFTSEHSVGRVRFGLGLGAILIYKFSVNDLFILQPIIFAPRLENLVKKPCEG